MRLMGDGGGWWGFFTRMSAQARRAKPDRVPIVFEGPRLLAV